MPFLPFLAALLSQYLAFLISHPLLPLGLVVVVELVRTRYREGLRHVPGPWLASLSPLWKVWVVWRGQM